MLYLALSCLQGRPMQSAFDELAALSGAVQLTPGNYPTPRFIDRVGRAATRRHHGFDYAARKREVWTDDARCQVDAESVHPPIAGSLAFAEVERRGLGAWLETLGSGAHPPVLETMYPGYVLGTGEAIEQAMRLRVRLAVDVSHAFIQLTSGAMTQATWRRLADYERIEEVHVSANGGKHDSHTPITDATFGVAWARERHTGGVPIILECYMHRLSRAERERQMTIIERGSP